MTVEIKLSDGSTTLLSDEDADLAHYAWYPHPDGYVQGTMGMGRRRSGLLHRAVAERTYGPVIPPQTVDHINRDRRDNRRENLRLASQSQNHANAGPHAGKIHAPGYRGVTWSASCQRWYARLMHEGHSYSLGRFKTQDEAAHAYDRKAREIHGAFALLNFPADDESN